MKYFFKILQILILSLMLFACSNNDILKQDDMLMQQRLEGNLPFNVVTNVERINSNTQVAEKLINDIFLIGDYNIDTANIDRISFEDSIYDVYSIPFHDKSKNLIISKKDNLISIVIGKLEVLNNGNSKYQIYNYNNELLFQVEQNKEHKFGNHIIENSQHGFFELIEYSDNKSLDLKSKTTLARGSCLDNANFSDCMQCAWDECSSSWVCGAILALRPVEVIASAVILCGANAILRAH